MKLLVYYLLENHCYSVSVATNSNSDYSFLRIKFHRATWSFIVPRLFTIYSHCVTILTESVFGIMALYVAQLSSPAPIA